MRFTIRFKAFLPAPLRASTSKAEQASRVRLPPRPLRPLSDDEIEDLYLEHLARQPDAGFSSSPDDAAAAGSAREAQ